MRNSHKFAKDVIYKLQGEKNELVPTMRLFKRAVLNLAVRGGAEKMSCGLTLFLDTENPSM